MAQTVWKGSWNFGPLSVPVKLTAAAREDKVSFSMVNPETGNKTSTKVFDAGTGELLERGQLAKTTELDDGQTVTVTAEDLKSILVESSKVMEAMEFVKLKDVDPVYFAASYYVVPDGKAGDMPFHLMRRALVDTKLAALVKLTRSSRESLALIRPNIGGGLTLHELFYASEVRPIEVPATEPPINPADLKLAKAFVRSMAREFVPETYSDAYREALLELIAGKVQPGQDFSTVLKDSVNEARREKRKAKAAVKKGAAK